MTYIISGSLFVVKNNSLGPTIIIWIIAAPGVISQDCSPLAGGTSQKNGKVVPQRPPSSLGYGQQRRSVTGMESEDARPPSRLGHRRKVCARASAQAHLWARWVRVARSNYMLKANVYRVLVQGRMNQLNTLEAIFCLYCWLVLWDLLQAPFDISFLRRACCFLSLFFSSRPNTFGHHCCCWQLPVAALNATGCEGMFTFPQLHCLWTVLNLTLIKHANNKRGSFFFFIMNVTCLSWKDMLLILAFHLNQESNTKQKSI